MNTIIDRYSDYTHVGPYGTYDVKSNTSTIDGQLFSRTVKIRKLDGSLALDTEWLTDVEMKSEIFGEDDDGEQNF